jgi:hypothetical protein
MKIPRLLASALPLFPLAALAHPGHPASPLHLHLGTPAGSHSLDLSLACIPLGLGLALLAARSLRAARSRGR